MKKKPSSIISFFALGVALIMGSQAVSFAAGTAGAQFLKLGAGARAAAMADAFSAVADDVTAAYWNPAGLRQIESAQVSAMHNSGLIDTNYQYLGGALPVGNKALALSVYRMDFGDIEGYDNSDNRTADFDAGSLATSLTWSGAVNDRLSLGLSAKYIQETIQDEKASGLAADIGLLYKSEIVNLGLVLQHFGSKMKFVQEEEDLPSTIRVGASRYFRDNKLLISADYSKPKDNDASIHAGLEYNLTDRFALRGGYKGTPGNELDVDGSTGLTGGIGVNLGRFSLDYAIMPFGDLGDNHRISLLFRFSSSDDNQYSYNY